jgi:hypothetical protein
MLPVFMGLLFLFGVTFFKKVTQYSANETRHHPAGNWLTGWIITSTGTGLDGKACAVKK